MRLNQIITTIYMAQEALGFMQNSKEKNLDFIKILSKEPDNILSLDVSSVKTYRLGIRQRLFFYTKQMMILLQLRNTLTVFPEVNIMQKLLRIVLKQPYVTVEEKL